MGISVSLSFRSYPDLRVSPVPLLALSPLSLLALSLSLCLPRALLSHNLSAPAFVYDLFPLRHYRRELQTS
jgi:hypothetical protein